MTACAFAIPGDLQARTGGYVYDRHLLAELPRYGVDITFLQLSQRFPAPSAADFADTVARFKDTPETMILLVDGLAYGTLPESLIAAARRKFVALVHHPLAFETGLAESRRIELKESERRALARANHIVATSATTARILTGHYGVGPDRLTVAMPGTEPAGRGRCSREQAPETLQLLAIGSIIPRKGYDLLVTALAALSGFDWQASIVGSHRSAPHTVASLRSQIGELGLTERIVLCGEHADEQLQELFNQSHVFVMPSLFEGYGMALCEAMARGLPLVTTTAGALADTVPDGAAIKVAPGSAEALANGLRRIMNDSSVRRRLASASWRAGQNLPNWPQTAAIVAQVLRRVADERV